MDGVHRERGQADRDVERALRGEDIDHDGRPDDFAGPKRFERERDGAAVLTR